MNAPANSTSVCCLKCKAPLPGTIFNLPDSAACPACGRRIRVEVFPALFREFTPGGQGETIMIEGEASCFYHPQKKAVVPCAACGRFLCALCDCELNAQHFCPACLESGRKKKKIAGLEDSRILYGRQALLLSILPLLITGLAAIYLALRYRQAPGSLVSPVRWAMPLALALGILQTLGITFLIFLAFKS